MSDYSYTIEVTDNRDGTYTATLDGIDCRVTAASPLLAVKAVNEAIVEWAELGGSDAWLDTPAGQKLARMLVREAL